LDISLVPQNGAEVLLVRSGIKNQGIGYLDTLQIWFQKTAVASDPQP
jgi:hypothetical protein